MSKSTILWPQFDPYRVVGVEFDLLSRPSTYGFLLPPNTLIGSKYNT